MQVKPILLAALVLFGFTLVGVSLVVLTHLALGQRIQDNQRVAMQRQLDAILPGGAEGGDNDPLSDRIEVTDPALLGAELTRIYRVRRDGRPVALVLDPVAPGGYAGPIQLLVSVLADGRIGGVRVISHRETPGLGDKLEEDKSDWVQGFAGKSLTQPPAPRWAVRRDGGDFDQFTGATITPRAVVRAVRNTLRFVEAQGERLYREPSTPSARPGTAPGGPP